jgi:hypothetical protein
VNASPCVAWDTGHECDRHPPLRCHRFDCPGPAPSFNTMSCTTKMLTKTIICLDCSMFSQAVWCRCRHTLRPHLSYSQSLQSVTPPKFMRDGISSFYPATTLSALFPHRHPLYAFNASILNPFSGLPGICYRCVFSIPTHVIRYLGCAVSP